MIDLIGVESAVSGRPDNDTTMAMDLGHDHRDSNVRSKPRKSDLFTEISNFLLCTSCSENNNHYVAFISDRTCMLLFLKNVIKFTSYCDTY